MDYTFWTTLLAGGIIGSAITACSYYIFVHIEYEEIGYTWGTENTITRTEGELIK